MSVDQMFPVIMYNASREKIKGVSTLCFPTMTPLDEKAILSTSVNLEPGSVIQAESESRQKYRSWQLVIGPIVHKNGNHCFKYEVFVKKFIETKISKTMVNNKKV